MPKRKKSNQRFATYEVGYARPPKRYQFQPGRVGNPTGINKKAASSAAQNFKISLERELNKKIKIRRGKKTLTVTQDQAGTIELVRRYVKGDPRARRDLMLLREKLGIDLIDRDALKTALEDVLSTEDEALLADFVRRHGGKYPVDADTLLANPAKDAGLLSSPSENAKLLAPPENPIDVQKVQDEE